MGATLLTVGLALGGFGVFAPGADAQGGNNGTVKIGDVVVDDGPSNDNDPMVECPLVIEWFGFDGAAATTATITPHNDQDDVVFQGAWAIPDTKTTPVQQSISPDLSSVPTGPHGHHVRITVQTTTAHGSDTKSKVIWVEGSCDQGGNPPSAAATIQVAKTVTGDNVPQAASSFTFTVSCTTGTVTGSPVTVAAGGSSTASVSWDGAGTAPSCTVTEDNNHGGSTTWSVNGGASTTGTVASTGALTDGGTTSVAFTNDYTRSGNNDPEVREATIQVAKLTTGTTSQASFPFTVSCTTGTVTGSPMSVAVGGSSTATVSWGASGAAPTCTVTETNTHGASSTTWTLDGTTTAGTAASVGSIDDGDTRVVTFTNAYSASQGGCVVGCSTPDPVVILESPPTTLPAPNLGTPQQVTPEPVIQVAGEEFVRPAPQPTTKVRGAQLARTGAATDLLILVAGACLLLGGVALAASKEKVAVPARRR